MAERSNPMETRAVLGVDAAWTESQPSGVALVVETAGGWRLAAVEASYDHFLGLANGIRRGNERPRGSRPDAVALLEAARKVCGRPVDLVAIDMPLSRKAIKGRRSCDDRISEQYGSRKAAVHSPSEDRPGKISGPLREGFERENYRLCGTAPARGLIEVYPHAALIEFLEESERLKYKAAKMRAYWPKLLEAAKRHRELRDVWARIVEALEKRIAGVAAALPPPPQDIRGSRLKAYEDRLDAVVCAAVAIAALDGKAEPYGDENAAIWVPIGAAVK